MYVIIGANGYLGSYIIKNVLEQTKEKVLATARDLSRVHKMDRVEWMSCDIQDDSSVDSLVRYINNEDNIKIVYLAAFHHPDKVEKNRKLAWQINVTALSKFLERIFEVRGVQSAVYASTDSVYGESIEGYHFKESDNLKPVNFYGHCKCAAEALMINIGFSVVRFPFLISPSIVYKPHFYDEIVKVLKDGNEFEMYEDSYRSSLSFDNAAYLLVKYMESGKVQDIVNICGDDDLSKYDVGRLIAQREGLDVSLIKPIRLSKAQENFTTKRANSTLMDNSRFKKIMNIERIDIFDRNI